MPEPVPAAAPAAPAAPMVVPPLPGVTLPVAAAPVAASPVPAAEPAVPGKVAEAPAAPAVPAEFVPKLPEGIKLDEKMFGEFKAIFTDAKKSGPEKMQALIDLQLSREASQTKAFAEAIAKQSASWLESVKADKEFGGAKFDATVAGARSAEAQFFGEEASKLFKELGIENHPALVKGLSRIRAAISEDNAAKVPTTPAPAPDTVEAQFKRQFPKSWPQMLQAHNDKLRRSGQPAQK